MKRVLYPILSFDEYIRNVQLDVFDIEEYEYFCKMCDVGRASEFTIHELHEPLYGFELAYNYCKENQKEFPEILVFANSGASKALCRLHLDGQIHINYSFGVEKHLNCTWNEVLNELKETLDILYRITDA